MPKPPFGAHPDAPRYYRLVEDYRRALLVSTLDYCDGNLSQAARLLGLGRLYLGRLLRQRGLRRPR